MPTPPVNPLSTVQYPMPPRMLGWALATVLLMMLALWLQTAFTGSLVAVTLYKAHLLALGGWGGYWLDRALFPYDRPHEYLAAEEEIDDPTEAAAARDGLALRVCTGASFGQAMLRRAIVVAACLICVGLGA